MKNLVSIIIPTKNRGEILIETITSFKNQTYRNWEIIIIADRGEVHQLKSVLQELLMDDRIFIFPRPSNYENGASACRNYGLTKARGKYIQFFDDDDLAHPDMIFEKVNFFETGNYDVVVHPLQIFKNNSNKPRLNKIFSEKLISAYLKTEISWYVCGPLWKKDWLKEKFDEDISMLDDWDFNLCNLYQNPSVGFLEKPLGKYMARNIERLSKEVTEESLKSQYYAVKKHFIIYKNELKTSEDLNIFFINRLISILRISLIKNYESSKYFYKSLMKEWRVSYSLKARLRVMLGYLSYKWFNKGDRFLNKIE